MEENSKKKARKVILTGDRPTGKLHLGHYYKIIYYFSSFEREE